MMGDAAHDSVHAKYPGKSKGETSPFAVKGDLKADYPADSSGGTGGADAAEDAAAEAAKHDEYDYWVNVCQSVMTPPKVGSPPLRCYSLSPPLQSTRWCAICQN
jgi:hypothetical protein